MVEVITTKQHLNDIAHEVAVLRYSNIKSISTHIRDFTDNHPPISEFVEILDKKAIVVVHCDSITSEITSLAIRRFCSLDNWEVGTKQFFEENLIC